MCSKIRLKLTKYTLAILAGSGACSHGAFAQTVATDDLKITLAGAQSDENFGSSIAVDGNTLVVGAKNDFHIGVGFAGSVSFYDADTGALRFTFIPSGVDEIQNGDKLGWSVAIDEADGYAVVGASQDNDDGPNAGAAYIVHIVTGSYVKIHGHDTDSEDRFGTSVAIENGIVAIGSPVARLSDDPDISSLASGKVYLFDLSGNQTSTILNQVPPFGHHVQDRFGSSVAIDGGILAVGARLFDFNQNINQDMGAAWLFDINTGLQTARLRPEAGDRFDGDVFGTSISIENELVIVGATGSGNGAAYIFDANDTGNIDPLIKLTAQDNSTGDDFGRSVSIHDGLAVVGAPNVGNLPAQFANAGAAYIFDAATGEQLSKLLPSIQSVGGNLGSAVAIQSSKVYAGASGDDFDKGAAYFFENNIPCNEADFVEPYGELDFFDISAFQSALAAMDPIADLNGDGEYDFFDISIFVAAIGAGCP